MEVEQAKSKLRSLEMAITTLVLEYQNRTGMTVDAIVLDKVFTLGRVSPGMVNVRVQAQL